MIMSCETPSTGPAAAMAAALQASIPTLETARLYLRAPRIEDFPYYAEIACGTRGVHLLEEASRENAWFDFSQMVANWVLRGHGIWAVVAKAEDRVAGFALLGFEPGDLEPELGYMFRDWAEGHGLAAEAATAARDHGFETLGLPTLVSTIDHENTRSAALAERLGAVRDATAEAAHEHKIMVYRHDAPRGLADA